MYTYTCIYMYVYTVLYVYISIYTHRFFIYTHRESCMYTHIESCRDSGKNLYMYTQYYMCIWGKIVAAVSTLFSMWSVPACVYSFPYLIVPLQDLRGRERLPHMWCVGSCMAITQKKKQ